MRDYTRSMHRTFARFWDTEIRPRFDAIAQQNPGWELWLTLLEATLREMGEPAWAAAVPTPQTDRPAGVPLLAGAVVTLDARAAHRWLQRLLGLVRRDSAGGISRTTAAEVRRLDALAFLEAAVSLDEARLLESAKMIGMDAALLGAVAQLAAMPLLQACRRALEGQASTDWCQGYCPICGTWPAIAELRGLERVHHLRCARCGADWWMAWLRCPYCGEAGHQRLGSLVPDAGGETRKVATCRSCNGYLKTLTTLQASPGYAVALDDVSTIELDIAALERGYARPQRAGYALDLHMRDRPSRLRGLFSRRG